MIDPVTYRRRGELEKNEKNLTDHSPRPLEEIFFNEKFPEVYITV